MNFEEWSAAIGAALKLQGYVPYGEGEDAFTRLWSKIGGGINERVEIKNIDPQGGRVFNVHYVRSKSDQTGEVVSRDFPAGPEVAPAAVINWLNNQT